MRDDIERLTEPDVEAIPPRPHLASPSTRFDASATIGSGAPVDAAERHRIAWVRISDLVNSSSGRLIGRGLDLQSELRRRLSSSPQPDGQRRRLAPLSAFGVRTSPTTARTLERS
ncbi:hypothetical protein [Microbacterium sp. C7(2022)]|uniref:hypothetical protein n=1 Tax=Microbacterium sp. C7(2022) TaxID=2992759 RepID=UPI00237A9180|nr:hypothetical protein [Microbacterium sp. C7(2022)]MDE0545933.1 hypothetical protein [Microbacterium sp. C7(2022)]